MRGCTFTEKDLQNFAEQYSRLFWKRSFEGRVELVEKEWKNTLGSFHVYRSGQKVIRMSRKTNLLQSDQAVLGTLKHELVHYWNYSLGKPFSDESKEFIAECMRIGAPFSDAPKAKKALGNYMEEYMKNYSDQLRKQS